jgi:hypothetical protein
MQRGHYMHDYLLSTANGSHLHACSLHIDPFFADDVATQTQKMILYKNAYTLASVTRNYKTEISDDFDIQPRVLLCAVERDDAGSDRCVHLAILHGPQSSQDRVSRLNGRKGCLRHAATGSWRVFANYVALKASEESRSVIQKPATLPPPPPFSPSLLPCSRKENSKDKLQVFCETPSSSRATKSPTLAKNPPFVSSRELALFPGYACVRCT